MRFLPKRFPSTLALALLCGLGTNVLAQTPEEAAQDWPNLNAYRQQDAVLRAQDPVAGRVVFMGDSITEFWDEKRQGLFSDARYVNRGISGQTTPQMLLRFRQDVIDLQPRTVVILAGTNDIAGNTGPASLETITNNIASMTDLAQAHGIQVVLASVLPTAGYPWMPEVKPIPRIAELNDWISQHARKHGFAYIDFYTPMADGHLALKAGYTEDGVHPNAAGYAFMTRLVESTLATLETPNR